MTLLYPMYLWAAGIIAAGAIGLHFIARRPQIPAFFPTVRFVPEQRRSAMHRAISFSDPALLLVRLLILLMLALAFAQPRWAPAPGSTARIVAVDVSASVARTAQWRQRVQRAAEDATKIIVFDATAREIEPQDFESLLRQAPVPDESSVAKLSVALIAASRAAEHLREQAETVQLTLISAFLAGSVDAATSRIRALWPSPIDLITVPAAGAADGAARTVEVHWVDETPSPIWVRRESVDTANGIYSEAATLIAPFERRWKLAAPLDRHASVIAWWLDGEPAAIEQVRGGVRHRSMGFALPEVGDTMLRPEFVRFKTRMSATPEVKADAVPLTQAELQSLLQPSLTPEAIEREPSQRISLWMIGWLAAGLVLVLFELLARYWLQRRQAHSETLASSAP